MRFVSASLAPVWKLFVAPDIPADAPASVTAPIDSYALPSGEVLKPVEIRLEKHTQPEQDAMRALHMLTEMYEPLKIKRLLSQGRVL